MGGGPGVVQGNGGQGVVQGRGDRGVHLALCDDVALVVMKHIIQLQVPVDDTAFVEVVQCQADLGNVEIGVLLNVEHQVTASSHKLNHEEHSARSNPSSSV